MDLRCDDWAVMQEQGGKEEKGEEGWMEKGQASEAESKIEHSELEDNQPNPEFKI